jgi:hypothetical protein
VDHRSFRDQLAFSIGYAVSRSRDLLRRLLKEHITDDARQQLAERVVEHLELSGFEIDEQERIMRKRTAGAGGSSTTLRPFGRLSIQPFQLCPRTLQAAWSNIPGSCLRA